MIKKLLSALLSVVITTSLYISNLRINTTYNPILSVFASDDESGKCGENVYYTFNPDTETLSFTGTGAIDNSNNTMFSLFEQVYNINRTSIFNPNPAGPAYIKTVIIEDGITEIGDSTFWGCSHLSNIIIPNSVTCIGSGAFTSCSDLSEICIPNTVSDIGSQAFNGCSSLSSVVLPDGITSIKNGTFSQCSSLTELVIPDSVTSIEEQAFSSCSSLVSVNIPNGVKEINDHTFWGCKSLTSVDIPDSVTRIADFAFISCSSLSKITIPASVTYIGFNAFSSCSDDLVIYGYANTAAKEYARRNSITFVELEEEIITTSIAPIQPVNQKYDMNGDHDITVADAILLMRYVAEENVDTLYADANPDVNDDTNVDIDDVVAFLQFLSSFLIPQN